uniref:Uncharacterized protein n=1 Tax=Ciona intestinalis TaxID=7719 RepID=F7AJJ2_CIOIN
MTGSTASRCVLTSQTSAAFDRAPPTCTPLQDLPQCEPQQRAPDHGSVQCTNTNLIGSVCTFSCGSGYYLSGSINVLICGALGEWSAIPPTCQRITCPPAFNNPTNGVVGCTDGINDGSVCSFGCAPGFSLIGAASSTCADDGNGDGVGLWSQPAPICQAITCSPQHTDPTNGNVNCINGNSLGSDCFFSCVDGYRMSGAPISTCTDDGNGDTNGVWSSPAPTCEPITCIPSHTSPTNGQVTCSNGNLVGSECVFTCSPGYAVTGEPVSICNQVNIGTPAGVWSSPPPTCQPQQCSPPHSNPVDGSVECSDGSNLNSQCDFVCNAGFSILGSPVSTCTVSANNNNNLIWSNPPPMCLPITCIPQQIPPTNGAVTCDNSNNVGSTCTFTCNAGYSVSGSPTTVCNDDFNGDAQGLWSSPPPTCQQQVCSPPHTAPADGSVACSDGSALGSQCEFACSLGFTLVGAPLSTCAVANGNTSPTWSHPAPTCAPVTCLPQQIPPTNGAVTCDNSNNVGSTCTFTCNAGYSVSGSPTTVCNDDFNGDAQGLWSSPPPTCQQLKCNPPQSNPTNGSVSCSDENNVNSECEFACMLGFTMVGEPITDCLMSGGVPAWTNVAPVCGPVICPAQQAPVNGGVTCTAGSNFGSVCSFQCSPGYALTGEPSATCNDDFNQDTLGVWSSPPPTCEPIVCNPRHVEPDNGAVICTNDNNLDSSCTFICANTYAIEGSPVSVCQDSGNGAQGSWSTPPPICTPIVCLPQHSSPANGGVQCTNSNFMGSSCTFTCDVGYDLLGEISSVCNLITATDAIGTWSAPAPICVERSRCSNPPSAPTNGYRVCSDGNYVGSICDYGCDDLYTRVGSQYSTCVELADGSHSFDNPAPTCERSSCRDVQTLPNGNVSCSDGNFINSVCTYDCNAGNAYALFPTNHSTTTCLNDTTWDLPPPCCATQCTPTPLNPENGVYECTDASYLESRCEYACNPGFAIVGEAVLTCTLKVGQASWSTPPPICQKVTCQPSQQPPLNGGISCTADNAIGSVCTFHCNAGYSVNGSAVSTCEDNFDGDTDGVWSSTPPTCYLVSCDLQPPPTNGGVLCTEAHNVGSVCTYDCDAGYALNGSAVSRCVDDFDGDTDGVWTSPPPICFRHQCSPPLADPENGFYVCSDGSYLNSRCEYGCNPGFAIVGEAVLTCTLTEGSPSWSTPPPICQIVSCDLQPPPINGGVLCTAGHNFGSVCTFHCNAGYSVNGSAVATCQDNFDGDTDGVWSSPPPICQKVTCSSLGTVVNGNYTCTDQFFSNSVCTFQCDTESGYHLIPANHINIRCLEDGSWDQDPPCCDSTQCSQVPPIPNGRMTCLDGNFVNSVCTFHCETSNGYSVYPETNNEITCLSNGTWDKQVPCCSKILCTAQNGPMNGHTSCAGDVSIGTVCSFVCPSTYKLVGEASSTCEEVSGNPLGIWSNDVPSCQRLSCSPTPEAPSNGNVSCSDGDFINSICSFTCSTGFTIIGPTSTTCQTNDSSEVDWNKPAPVCQQITCDPEQTSLPNGGVTCTSSNHLNSECSFTCNDGYMLSGSATSTCNINLEDNEHGSWSNEPPVCQEILCTAQNGPMNGHTSCAGTVCSFVCPSTYKLVGEASSTCEEVSGNPLGIWSNDVPSCQQILCTAHAAPENGGTSCIGEVAIGTVCSFSCSEGYRLLGPSSSTCGENSNAGTWNKEAPTCKRLSCSPTPEAPSNGNVSCSDGDFINSICSFTCSTGFTIIGPTSTTCQTNDSSEVDWNKPAPVCQRKRCPTPPSAPLNGFISCTPELYVGSSCEFECDQYHRPVGPLYITCVDQENAAPAFDNTAPVCERIECNAISSLKNGHINCTDDNFVNSVCTFQCDSSNGYFLFPANETTSTCLNDTTWNKPTPCCARSCPPYASMDFVMVVDSSSSIGRKNWRIMKEFGRNVLNTFVLAEDAARMAVFRYNRKVDNVTQVLLNDHIGDKDAFLAAYDRINYNGRGTWTGHALQHAKDVMLAAENGNRADIKDVVLTITDGRAQDNV